MDKIIDYSLLIGDDLDQLEIAVKDEMKNGWQPLGGPAPDIKGYILQAMVKYQSQAKKEPNIRSLG